MRLSALPRERDQKCQYDTCRLSMSLSRFLPFLFFFAHRALDRTFEYWFQPLFEIHTSFFFMLRTSGMTRYETNCNVYAR